MAVKRVHVFVVAGVLLALPFAQIAQQPQAGRGGQASKKTSSSVQSDDALAKPLDGGLFTTRLAQAWQRVTFKLMTSWIPGENRKGMCRYKLEVSPEKSDPADTTATTSTASEAESTEELMTGVSKCRIFLNLYDSDGFILRKAEVLFTLGVDEKARLKSLWANDSLQMEAREYRQFVAGAWNVTWSCGPR